MAGLIDVGALINDVTERYCKDCERRKGIKNGKRKVIYDIGDAPCRACAVYDMIDALENAPRVDPVKHGHWIIEDIITYERSYGGTLYEPVYKCSCCGRVTESYVRGDEPIMPEDADFPEFCGNCGAKMDEMKVNNSKGIDLWMTKEDFNSLYEDDVEDGV